MADNNFGAIETFDPDETERHMRFFVDDKVQHGVERIYFIAAGYNQHLMLQQAFGLPYDLYCHDHAVIDEIVDNFEDMTGLVLPNEFCRGTHIYNVRGILMDKGMVVSHRVLRQQIFLGARTDPVPRNETYRLVFNSLGNAIWNFLDHKVWKDRTERNQVKNRYRDLRGMSPDGPLRRRGDSRAKHQENLFYIAAEDFRCLFGPVAAGQGEWHLDGGSNPVSPPSLEVADFWREELGRYDQSYSAQVSPEDINIQIGTEET